ncbi:MAG TPA: hypothetical protein VN765_09120 [Candidatus Acidoferrum sp.]|nr:hypothetical protein [Candidatus Acidoferrum sp.]
MKNFIRWTLALAAGWTLAQANATLFAQFFGDGQGARRDIVLTIHADGSCEVRSLAVLGRPAAEQQARMMEMQQKMEEAGEAEDMTQMASLQAQAKTNTFTDEQLKEKYVAMTEERSSMMGEEAAEKPNVTVDKDNVTATKKTSFASIKEMLQSRSALEIASDGLIDFQNMRFEQDTNGHLMLTLTPMAGMKRQLKNMRTEMKMMGVSGELRFVFPGKVLSSSLPETQTNATWIAVDSKKDESLDALAKLYDGPVVITAEAAGLTLKEPLELSKLRAREGGRTGEMGEDLPITEAGAGFVAQAEGISTTTLHIFPGGEDFFKNGNMLSGEQAGTMVHGKLFAPKGRSLQSVTDVKLLAATDDKGRAVAAGKNDEGEEMNSYAYVQSGMEEGQENAGAQVQLRLELPQPDAQAIDEISAEAVAVTAGSWKEMTLTNITETSTNEFDIGAALPGAKLVLSKITMKNNTLSLQGQIKGPATVKNLKVQVKVPGSEQRNYFNFSGGNVSTKNGETTRSFRVNGSVFNMNGQKSSGPYQLLIRYPEDLKRERVNFKLKGLDLL